MQATFPRIGFKAIFLFLLAMTVINLLLTKPIMWLGFGLRDTMFISNSLGGTITLTLISMKIVKQEMTWKKVVLRVFFAAIISVALSYLIVYEN